MGTDLSFDIARTALLAMDCQTGIVSIYAKPQQEFLERAASVLRAARTAEMTVIQPPSLAGELMNPSSSSVELREQRGDATLPLL